MMQSVADSSTDGQSKHYPEEEEYESYNDNNKVGEGVSTSSFYEEALRASAAFMLSNESPLPPQDRNNSNKKTLFGDTSSSEGDQDGDVQEVENGRLTRLSDRRTPTRRRNYHPPAAASAHTTAEADAAQVNEIRHRQGSMQELVLACLQKDNQDLDTTTTLPPELYRRVMDYRLAQTKRYERDGETKKWGIYGVYRHLANVRTDLEWAEDAAWRRQHGYPYLSWSDFTQLKQRHAQLPYFAYLLMSVCTCMLVVEFGVNSWRVEPLSENPLVGVSAQTLVDLGALDTSKIVEEGQWFRLFSPLILHAGIFHWIVNMIAIYIIGGALEESHGTSFCIAIFLLSCVGGNVLSALFLPQYISVGASGGIFGYMGACVADLWIHRHLLFLKEYQGHEAVGDDQQQQNKWKRQTIWALFWMGVEVVVNILLGLTPYIDNFIHVGGFVYGALAGWSLVEYGALNFLLMGGGASSFTENNPSTTATAIRTVWRKFRLFTGKFAGLMLSAAALLATIIWLATLDMGNEGASTCPNCRYFNCVPFPSRQNPWWYCDDCQTVSADLFRLQTADASYYSRVELTCPDGVLEAIDVSNLNITNKETLVDQLPDFCRQHCENVYQS